jgi:hypothetical protein
MFDKLKTLLVAFYVVSQPSSVFAHASEQGLVMLLPTELYTLGGTLAVGASILWMGFLPIKRFGVLFGYRTLGYGQLFKQVETPSSILATMVFFALVFVGFTGPNDPQSNLLPLFIWTGWWIGVFVIQGFIFDIWRLINPWTGLARFVLGSSTDAWKIPEQLGHWPAVIVFLCFQLFLLADIAPNDPDRLAMFALAVQSGESYRVGLPGWASIATAPLDTSRAVFCIMILISGSFDGLHETFWWLGTIGINPLEFPGRSAVVWSTSIGLLVANIGGVAIYGASIWLGLALVRCFDARPKSGIKIKFKDAFNTFAIAILPIALGYHFAHYLISFLVQVQYLAATIGDPLAKGWNMFGLGQLPVKTGFLNTMDSVRPILLTNVAAVVLSHILSVIVAHRLAGMFCSTRKNILLIQCGLSLLMIIYTIFGLWLLSTPRGA